MIKFDKINTLKPFDWFLILGVVASNIMHMILTGSFDIMGSLAGITGVVCVVLVAKGNIFNYLFGLINVSLYAIISFKAELYGDAALNALYYLPMQFVGWMLWLKKRESEVSVTVVGKRLNLRERLVLSVVSLSLVLIVAFILKIAGDPQPLKDSATTVLSVIAMFLMVKTYMEQWVLWVAVNIISIVMWTIAYANGVEHSLLMVIMWIFYLANSVNGWINWAKLTSAQSRT
ncbi:MAG: nicotinamide riboside transporter PnuC [Bacteroidales bacterium]|jgi:nicotinamide mononucleotide transporter|nr:nicotinamide riboside transporter PnuC [Bacteroidales bacterium]